MFSFDVCTGPLQNMNVESFNTKGCSSSSIENLLKIENLCVPDFVSWVGLLAREHLEALSSIFSDRSCKVYKQTLLPVLGA